MQPDGKSCPHCGLLNLADAERCDCNYDFASSSVPAQGPPADIPAEKSKSLLLWVPLYVAAFMSPAGFFAARDSDWSTFLHPEWCFFMQLRLPFGVFGFMGAWERSPFMSFVAVTISATAYLALVVQGFKKRSWALFVLLVIMQACLYYGCMIDVARGDD